MNKLKLSSKDAENLCTALNCMIEKYCEKYPDEFEFENESVGYDNEGVVMANEGSLSDVLDFVANEVVPSLFK